MYEFIPLVYLTTQVLAMSGQISALTTREASSSQESVMVANASYVGDGSDQEKVHFVNNRNYN